MISHSKTLLLTSPQLMPGMSLSVCMCLNCLLRRMAAEEAPPGDPAVGRYGLAMLGLCRESLLVRGSLGNFRTCKQRRRRTWTWWRAKKVNEGLGKVGHLEGHENAAIRREREFA